MIRSFRILTKSICPAHTSNKACPWHTLVSPKTVPVDHAPAFLFQLSITTTSLIEPASLLLEGFAGCLLSRQGVCGEPRAEPQVLTTPYRFLTPPLRKTFFSPSKFPPLESFPSANEAVNGARRD